MLDWIPCLGEGRDCAQNLPGGVSRMRSSKTGLNPLLKPPKLGNKGEDYVMYIAEHRDLKGAPFHTSLNYLIG